MEQKNKLDIGLIGVGWGGIACSAVELAGAGVSPSPACLPCLPLPLSLNVSSCMELYHLREEVTTRASV